MGDHEAARMNTKTVKQVEDMPVYQLFYDAALQIERNSRAYGPDFRWLRSQSLRASESVCANMTEGFYSQYSTEYLQCLYRCRREARETMTHLKYASDAGCLPVNTAKDLSVAYGKGCHQLGNLIKSIEKKIESRGKAKPRDHQYVNETLDTYLLNHQPSTIYH